MARVGAASCTEAKLPVAQCCVPGEEHPPSALCEEWSKAAGAVSFGIA